MAADWAQMRSIAKIALRLMEDESGVLIFFNGREVGGWWFDFDEDIFWPRLDVYLQEYRPAGRRCWPGVVTDADLDELVRVTTDHVLAVTFHRTNARTIRIEMADAVTGDDEIVEVTWTPETTRNEFLEILRAPLEQRVSGYKNRRLSEDELNELAGLSDEQQAKLNNLEIFYDRFYMPTTLGYLIGRARAGDLQAHGVLRLFLDDMNRTCANLGLHFGPN